MVVVVVVVAAAAAAAAADEAALTSSVDLGGATDGVTAPARAALHARRRLGRGRRYAILPVGWDHLRRRTDQRQEDRQEKESIDQSDEHQRREHVEEITIEKGRGEPIHFNWHQHQSINQSIVRPNDARWR